MQNRVACVRGVKAVKIANARVGVLVVGTKSVAGLSAVSHVPGKAQSLILLVRPHAWRSVCQAYCVCRNATASAPPPTAEAAPTPIAVQSPCVQGPCPSPNPAELERHTVHINAPYLYMMPP